MARERLPFHGHEIESIGLTALCSLAIVVTVPALILLLMDELTETLSLCWLLMVPVGGLLYLIVKYCAYRADR